MTGKDSTIECHKAKTPQEIKKMLKYFQGQNYASKYIASKILFLFFITYRKGDSQYTVSYMIDWFA